MVITGRAHCYAFVFIYLKNLKYKKQCLHVKDSRKVNDDWIEVTITVQYEQNELVHVYELESVLTVRHSRTLLFSKFNFMDILHWTGCKYIRWHT